MLNHLYVKVTDLRLTADDVVAQTASQCFDISVWQFLAALLAGGTVEIFPDEITHDPARLAGELARTGVTVFETVPSLLSLMLDEIEAGTVEGDLTGLHWLIPTGEALPPELAQRWLARHPAIPLLNAYGPTECSDDITHEPVRQVDEIAGPRVPIGRPVRGMALYLLDGALHPVPWGVPGELYAAGAGLGRGYLGDGARTALAFVPDAISGRAGERLYKTGDRVRALPDGRLDFLGRVDFQVKVRGFRIELGEIEAVLAACPGVRQAVVADREVSPGDTRLVAWVVPEGRPGPTAEELRRHVANHLPEYMVPAAFVSLDGLPLSANGKVDRKALPSPDAPAAGSGAAYAAPRSEVEVAVAAVWSEVLGVPRVGVADNFFDLGGHSLLLVQ
ncbi:MAG TPA: non-ribosomal peptide synthetase, partial [Methylomirabilota bacterium]|nr:non-ribosomal peptide synthetase [Methylomirabilota bacterium]